MTAGPNPFARMYDRPEIVAGCRSDELDQSEGRLLQELIRRGGHAEMLDLGVGAGRTTAAFAHVTRSYLGIDIAPRMIEACRERFGTLRPCEFRVGDAADLTALPDAAFDTVLFSFNGIGCLAPGEREQCLRGVRRVLRPGGVFLFSAHNLQMIDLYYQVPPAGSAVAALLTPARRAAIAQFNNDPASYAERDWALFWDGVYGDNGELRHVYIRPRHQLQQLHVAGFSRARAISTITGADLTATHLDTNRDLSVAYWCDVGTA